MSSVSASVKIKISQDSVKSLQLQPSATDGGGGVAQQVDERGQGDTPSKAGQGDPGECEGAEKAEEAETRLSGARVMIYM